MTKASETVLKPLKLAKSKFFELFKIPVFALKEIHIVRAQKLSYLLVFLYPVLAMLSIALVVSGTTLLDVSVGNAPSAKIAIGVYSPKGLGSEEVLESLESFEYLDIYEFSDKESMVSALESSKISLGMEIVPPENEFSVIGAEFLYDNSNFVASSTIVSQLKTVVQNIGLQKSGEILSSLISDINSIQSTIFLQIEKTGSLTEELESGDAELEELETSLNQLDLNSLRKKLADFNAYYSEGKEGVSSSLSDINSVSKKVDAYKVTISDLRVQVAGVQSSVESVIGVLDSSIQAVESNGLEQVAAQLNSVKSVIVEQDQKLLDLDVKLETAQTDLADIEEKLSVAKTNLELADQRLDLAKASMDELDQNLSFLETILVQAKSVISQTKESKAQVKSDLVNAKALFEGLAGQLGYLKNYSPEYLSSPIQVRIEPLYGFSQVTSLIPFTVAFVLLLTCLLLASTSMINEFNWGILFRLGSSSTSLFSWLFGKILGQTILALFEAVLVFIVGIVFFSVPVPANIDQVFFAIVLISVTFISIGLWLTNFIKNSSTSILASLLLIVPMVFLSGILVPIQFMPGFLSSIARVLPLTLAIDLLSATFLREVAVGELIPMVMPLAFVSMFCFLFTYFNYKRKK